MSMVPQEAPKNEPEQSAGPPQRGKRGRHAGRGRRGRGGRGRRPQPPPSPGSEAVPPERQDETAERVGSPALEGVAEPERLSEPETAPEPVQPPIPAPSKHPASPDAVQDAIEMVNRIIDSLRESLDDMEEVLETLELAERQKTADEQEIEQLRRSLRHMQHPRDRDRGHSRENR